MCVSIQIQTHQDFLLTKIRQSPMLFSMKISVQILGKRRRKCRNGGEVGKQNVGNTFSIVLKKNEDGKRGKE